MDDSEPGTFPGLRRLGEHLISQIRQDRAKRDDDEAVRGASDAGPADFNQAREIAANEEDVAVEALEVGPPREKGEDLAEPDRETDGLAS